MEDKINSFDLQLLNVKSSHKLARHYYAFAKDNALANLIIVQGSIDIVGQHIKERYMTEDTVAVYGHRLAVGQFIQDITGLLEEQIQSRIVSEE